MREPISCIRWGFFLILLDIRLGRFDILPDFAGYYLWMVALTDMWENFPDARRLRSFCKGLAVFSLIDWLLDIEISLLTLILTLVSLYVIYGILTQVVTYAEREGYEEARSLAQMRNVMAFYQAGMVVCYDWLKGGWATIVSLGYVILQLRIILHLSYVVEAEEKKEQENKSSSC
ncbi:MAG: hypothetical protein HFI33_14920 [Lachnospiraceae bacterium]|nr:hypothetical protein [Lachnospiraceae bacterium]